MSICYILKSVFKIKKQTTRKQYSVGTVIYEFFIMKPKYTYWVGFYCMRSYSDISAYQYIELNVADFAMQLYYFYMHLSCLCRNLHVAHISLPREY